MLCFPHLVLVVAEVLVEDYHTLIEQQAGAQQRKSVVVRRAVGGWSSIGEEQTVNGQATSWGPEGVNSSYLCSILSSDQSAAEEAVWVQAQMGIVVGIAIGGLHQYMLV